MKRILITRPRVQSTTFAENLRYAGFEPYFFPVIEIRPIVHNPILDDALSNIDRYDWVIFTSINAVEVVFARISPETMNRAELKIAAIGPKTSAAIVIQGLIPDFIPDEYVAEAIPPGLGNLKGKHILLPRAEIARKALPESIIQLGGYVDEIAVYHTQPAYPNTDGFSALHTGVDIITLTSPSTVINFTKILQDHGLNPNKLPGNPVYACIGPITEEAANKEGLQHLLVAKEYTTEGIIKAIYDLER